MVKRRVESEYAIRSSSEAVRPSIEEKVGGRREMKGAVASWLKGMNVNVAGVLVAVLTFALSMLAFGLMVRGELSAFRAETRADNAEFREEVRSDLEEMRADNAEFEAEVRADIAEIRADNKELGEQLDNIESVLDTRLDDIEREQARMQGVTSVLQDAVDVSARQPDNP